MNRFVSLCIFSSLTSAAFALTLGCDPSLTTTRSEAGAPDGGSQGDGGVTLDGGPPETVGCDGPAPTSFVHTPGKEIDYEVTCNLPIEKPTSIGSGTVIAFHANSGFQVRGVEGSLKAGGTAEAPIVMQPATGEKWTGIYFFTTSASNLLERVKIRNAGAQQPNLAASVLVGAASYAGGTLAIRDCVIEGSFGPGLSVGEGGTLSAIERTAISGGEGAPVEVSVHNVGALAGAGNKFGGNARDRVEVFEINPGADVLKDQTWAKLDVPYYVKNFVRYRGVQTISPGVEIILAPDAALEQSVAEPTNRLKAVGTAAETITFRGEGGAVGKWGALWLHHAGNELAHCRVSGGGSTGFLDNKGNILALAGSVSIRDCVIEGSAAWGIFKDPTATVDIGANVTFQNNVSGNVSP